LSDLAKYSMTRSIARPLCDNWASCYNTFHSKFTTDADYKHLSVK